MPTFYERFVECSERWPKNVAVEIQRAQGVESYTYTELRRMAESFAAWLLAHSLKLRHILALHHFRRVALALTVAFAALPPSRGLFEVSLHGAVGTCFRLFGLSPDGVRH